MYRYLRLTPLLAVVLWCYVSIVPVLSHGPLQQQLDSAILACTENSNWVYNLFYLNSIFPLDRSPDEACMGWTWVR